MEEHSEDSSEPTKTETSKKKVLLLAAHFKSPLFKGILQKKWARITATAIVLAPLAVLLAWWGWNNSSLSKLGVDTALVEGTAQFRLDEGDAWEKLQSGMSLGEGAHVRTLADSRVVLNIDDGSAVRLNSGSSVILKKLTSKHIIIQNTGGDVYTRVVKSDERAFQVVSGKTTYESLGTAYRTLNTEEKEGVEVYHSKVNILGVDQIGAVLVEQGERYYLLNKGSEDTEGKVTELTAEELATDDFIKWNGEQDKKDFEDELGVLFDLEPPKIEISTPANGFETEAAKVEVKGTTEKGAKVSVNGDSVENNEGQFAVEIKLNEGKNSIQVVAEDGAGNKTVKTLSVTRNSEDNEPTQSFKLTGTKVDDGISFSWSISGITIGEGFKLIKSKEANPSYPGDSAVFLDSKKRSYTWGIKDGGTYHFRICAYDGDGCTRYSNDITVTAPKKTYYEQPTGTLDLTHTGSGNFEWQLDGSAPYGFKLVWSSTPEPAYPDNKDGANYYDKSADSGEINPDSGHYYVRVCMYYDGGCKNYSNEVEVNL